MPSGSIGAEVARSTIAVESYRELKAMTLRKPRLGPERRGALGILDDAPRGLTESILLAHGVTDQVIASLVRDGLATMRPENTREGVRTVDVIRVKITDAGRRALEG